MPQTRGDPILIYEVLKNLLANAWKFSRHKETTDIEMSGQVQDHQIVKGPRFILPSQRVHPVEW